MTWDIYIILGSFINGLNYCCHIVCYRTVQSLYVVALAWWPNKLKGHRSYPRNSSYARHCRGGLLNHTRRRELRVSCIYIHLGGICKEKHALLLSWLYRMWWFTAAKKGLHVPKKKNLTNPTYIPTSQLISDCCWYSSPLLVQSEPHCEAAGYISSFYMDQCQLTGKIDCNLLGIGSV